MQTGRKISPPNLINQERFRLALERLSLSEDWSRFERLSSSFLAAEFPQLRTVAAPNGDGGRDSELFGIGDTVRTVFQYSITKNWRAKIRSTKIRLAQTLPDVHEIIYLSPQIIGAEADDLKAELRLEGYALDTRDRNWFIERANRSAENIEAAAELARIFVDPLLDRVSERTEPLNVGEAGTLLFHLELQQIDIQEGKNLTRICYESVVRAALSKTTKAKPMSEGELRTIVSSYLPIHKIESLMPLIFQAIKRLHPRVREVGEPKHYYLVPEEIDKLKKRANDVKLLRVEFLTDIEDAVASDGRLPPHLYSDFSEYLCELIEKILYLKGEQFATALTNGGVLEPSESEVYDVALRSRSFRKAGHSSVDIARSCIKAVLRSPSPRSSQYLSVLGESYTLMAALCATPDVQAAIKKVFDAGEMIVDTSVLLPAIAEKITESKSGFFLPLLTMLSEGGIKLFTLPGVIDELASHIAACRDYSRRSAWSGQVPFLMRYFLAEGGEVGTFSAFIDDVCGEVSPERDLKLSLREDFDVRSIEPEMNGVPEHDIQEIKQYWEQVNERRRPELDSLKSIMLARHDAESIVTVLKRRRQNGDSQLGYSCWWLTVDTFAPKMLQGLSLEAQKSIKHSPVISLDFLTRYLAIGPRRSKQIDSAGALFAFVPELAEAVPAHLMAAAQEIRRANSGLSSRIIKRRISEKLDKLQTTYGPVQAAGFDAARLLN